MDVSFSNVLEGARQYFQGLPAPSATTVPPTSSSSGKNNESNGYTSQQHSKTTSSDSRYDENKSTDTRDADSYWSSPNNPNELRAIVEPYPPQPTRVEVPDTRPDDGGPDGASNTNKSLTEMQPPSRPQSQNIAAASPSPKLLHQLEPQVKSPHSPPVYQQLNTVPRSSPYRASEMFNSHPNYQHNHHHQSPSATGPGERPPSAPIVAAAAAAAAAAQRTQYYPRYHHPDITKSAPVPFSQSSIYQSPQTATSTPSSVGQIQQQPQQIDLDANQHHQPSNYSAYQGTNSNRDQSNRPGLPQNSNQPSLLHHQVDGTHSMGASSSNPCSPRHIPSSQHNHPGQHLPVPSVPSPHHHQQQQHLQNQHPSRMNTSPHITSNSYPRVTNPYPMANVNQQQMLPPSSSSSSSSSSTTSSYHSATAASPHESNHHASPSPQRQSPHVTVVHNPHNAISPHHHTPSPHHHNTTPSPHSSGNFQPHSPTYPPPPLPTRSPVHPYGLTAVSQHHRPPSANYPASAYSPHQQQQQQQSSYHSYQKNSQSGVYSQSAPRSQQHHPYSQQALNQPTPPLPPASTSSASNHVNGVSPYLTSSSKSAGIYNGGTIDPKRTTTAAISANQITSYNNNNSNSYRMPAVSQRNTNTHNLPITAVSSYHSNRNSREAVGKAQTISRQRAPMIVPSSNNNNNNNNSNSNISGGSGSSSVSQSTVHSPRGIPTSDYQLNSSSNVIHPATTPTSSYSNNNLNTSYSGSNYRNFATTVAPSHHGSNSTTTVTSIGVPAPSAVTTVHARPSSDPATKTSGAYHHSASSSSSSATNTPDNYPYKDYPYGSSLPPNSQSGVAGMRSSAQSSSLPVNGLPLRKRESPLDLSVKTIKTSADSTARDDFENGSADKQVTSSSSNSSSNNNPRTSAGRNNMLPPAVQPAGVTPYVTYDSRRNPVASTLRPSTPQMPVCAPKVDFLPNFNSTPLQRHHQHHQHQHQMSQQPNHMMESPLRRSSSQQQLYVPQAPHHSNSMPLPHMSSFKKSSLPTGAPLYDNKGPLTSSSYSSDLPNSSRSSFSRYPATVDPARPPALPVHDYPASDNKYYMDSRNKQQQSPYHNPHQQNPHAIPQHHHPHSHPSHHNYPSTTRDRVGLKRPGEPISMAGSEPGSTEVKQSRGENWKAIIDKELQQKLEKARILHEQQKRFEMTLPRAMPNGTLVAPSSFNQRDNPVCPAPPKKHTAFCDKRAYAESSKLPRDSNPVSYNSNNPSSNNSSSNSNNSSTMGPHSGEKSSHTSAAQSSGQPTASQMAYPPTGYPRQSLKSPYLSVPPQSLDQPGNNTGADKRVLSLLRNSLENKQQREEQLNSQQPILVNHSQQSFQNKVVAPVEPKTNIGRHNLSPFTAASLLERNSNTPPHYKFHVPRAVDSITQETPRSLYASRVNSSATLPAGKEALLGPRELENQIHRDKDDSLAAILAAKIRTKAELKQVGTGQFASKPVLLSQDTTPNDYERVASTSTPQSVASSAGSPPKLTCEKTACLPPRRRLFSRSDEDNMPVAATIPAAQAAATPAPIKATGSAATVASRASGFRSSSETSVFDFRESDSEGEMPVLERQTLEEMRRDRKQLSKVQPPVSLDDAMCIGMTSSVDLVKIELKENDSVGEVDPFWSATCDKFIEQLRGGGSTTDTAAVKKRGRKRKIGDTSSTTNNSAGKSTPSIIAGTTNSCSKTGSNDSKTIADRKEESKASSAVTSPIVVIKPEDIKKEINEEETTSATPASAMTTKGTTAVKNSTLKSENNEGETKNKVNAESVKPISPKIDTLDSTAAKSRSEAKIKKDKKDKKDTPSKTVPAGKLDKVSNNTDDDESVELPIVKRKTRKKASNKKEDSDCDEEIVTKKRQVRRGSRIKLESSSASESSSDEGDREEEEVEAEAEADEEEEEEEEEDDEEEEEEESDASTEFGRGSTVAQRLRPRKRAGKGSAAGASASVPDGMKLRPREAKTKEEKPQKAKNNVSQKFKPKPLFGDGSDFRPGWEEEVFIYKKSLRMPARLISVSKPSRFHRLSTSLPDLDPDSPGLSTVSMDSADVCLLRKRGTIQATTAADSDVDSNYSFSISGLGLGLGGGSKVVDDEEATSSTTVSCPPKTTSTTTTRQTRSESNSIVDLLARKVGGSGKKDGRKKFKDKFEKSLSSSKILPKGSNEPELLATPSFSALVTGATANDNNSSGNSKVKGNNSKTPTKNSNCKLLKQIDATNESSSSSYLLGYFRKETVNNFRDTFKNNYALPNEFSTFILKSRTRTETRVMKKQATIREVFGEDRPASAPPMQNHAGDTSQDDDSQTDETKESTPDNRSSNSSNNKSKLFKQKVVNRLRNAGILRSNKAVNNSKRHLLTVQRRRVLMNKSNDPDDDDEDDDDKAKVDVNAGNVNVNENKSKHNKSGTDNGNSNSNTNNNPPGGGVKMKKEIKKEEDDEADVAPADDDDEDDEQDEDETEDIQGPDNDNNDGTEILGKKKLKLRTGRRKFRSGFDYIRKKKKPLKKDDTATKERKKPTISRPNAESVADIQNEIRTWVIKKGVGETILHRAARLGYTDVAAYCLEKLSSVPSPKDNAGYTPLHEACSRGHLEIAKLLLAYGANVSESANGGIRPLHEAAENGATELVRLLLSYGADPLLATYAGQTPLMLADKKAHEIIEQHLDDVQGRSSEPWSFAGPATIFDPEETGYNPLEDPPIESAESEIDEVEMEVSDVNLPVLFSIANDPDKWVLLQDLMAASKLKSRDALLRQINPKASGPPAVAHRSVMREFKLSDFLEQSRCCHLLNSGERINVRGSKVTLIKYNDKVKSLLNVERVVINLR